MKKFFNISKNYNFEWNDIRAFFTLLNVIGIVCFGLVACYLGLAISVFGIVKDLTNKNRHINDIIIHFSTMFLNFYLLLQFYS